MIFPARDSKFSHACNFISMKQLRIHFINPTAPKKTLTVRWAKKIRSHEKISSERRVHESVDHRSHLRLYV